MMRAKASEERNHVVKPRVKRPPLRFRRHGASLADMALSLDPIWQADTELVFRG